MIYSSYLIDGSFYQVFGGTAPTLAELGLAVGFVSGEYTPSEHYYDHEIGVPMSKTQLALVSDKSIIAADGKKVATISGIPAGVYVSLNGVDPVLIGDSVVTFKTLDAGDHSLVFSSIKHLPQEITIGAV